MTLNKNQLLSKNKFLIFLISIFLPQIFLTDLNSYAQESYKLNEMEINRTSNFEEEDNFDFPTNPFEIVDKLRRANSMNDATKPIDAIDDAIKSFDMIKEENKIWFFYGLDKYFIEKHFQMIKSPIPKVSNKKQFRAIGIVFGMYKPHENNLLNKGFIKDKNGVKIDAVVLGKTLPLIKKFINFDNQYYWIVYPRNKNSENIHFQIVGIWDPNNFKNYDEKNLKNNNDLLLKLGLKDNLFSIRGKLIFINVEQKEFIIKICPSNQSTIQKNKSFKILVKGEIAMKYINSFVSLEAIRIDNSLFLENFEIIDDKTSESN